MRDPRAMPPAFLASALAHLALLAAVGLSPGSKRGEPATAPPLLDPVDVWAGTTAALPGTGARTYDVEVGQVPPKAAPPPAPPQSANAEGSAQASVPPRTGAGGEETKDPPPPARTAVRPPAREARTKPLASRVGAPAANAPESATPGADEQAAAAGAGAGIREGSGRGELGAEGPGAVRSLGRAFTRAIPPACQADPAWASLPVGSAGTARVVLSIDEAGHIAGWKLEGTAPAKHLEGLVKRTVALLQSGTFAVQGGGVTAGKQTLEIGAVLSDAAAGEEGAADSLAWRFEEGRGTASFTQATGRRVEITLRVIRTEVTAAAPPG